MQVLSVGRKIGEPSQHLARLRGRGDVGDCVDPLARVVAGGELTKLDDRPGALNKYRSA